MSPRLFTPLAIITLLLAASPCLDASAQQPSTPPALTYLPAAPSDEINTLLMHATFLIYGKQKNHPDKIVTGTIFVMAVQNKDDAEHGVAVLITAAHVLDDIGDSIATLVVRRKNSDDTYAAYETKIPIRDNDRNLYVKHPSSDVAAMYVELPTDVNITGLPLSFLADDKKIEELDLHPGDEVFCLGFPLATSTFGGFPILRKGYLASYPLTPTKLIGKIGIDLPIFGGNSGGPIYFYYTNRVVHGSMQLGTWQRGVLGLVTQSTNSPFPEYKDERLGFGIMVPAVFIRETIDLLPPPTLH